VAAGARAGGRAPPPPAAPAQPAMRASASRAFLGGRRARDHVRRRRRGGVAGGAGGESFDSDRHFSVPIFGRRRRRAVGASLSPPHRARRRRVLPGRAPSARAMVRVCTRRSWLTPPPAARARVARALAEGIDVATRAAAACRRRLNPAPAPSAAVRPPAAGRGPRRHQGEAGGRVPQAVRGRVRKVREVRCAHQGQGRGHVRAVEVRLHQVCRQMRAWARGAGIMRRRGAARARARVRHVVRARAASHAPRPLQVAPKLFATLK
jgi:hypothetical protein